MRSRKQALLMAKQYRQCPPPDVAEDPSYRDQIKKHLSICPYCSTDMDADTIQWAGLSQKILDKFPASPKIKDVSPLPGQFRQIKSGLADFKDGLYYSPPLVLIVKINEYPAETVIVAQTFHDIALAGPKDLILTANQTKIGDLFVECYHIYTLKSEDLEPPVGQIDSKLMADIKQMIDNSGFLPDWAMLPTPLTEHDPRKYFREMEVETGYFFASKSVGFLMTALKEEIRLIYTSSHEVLQALKEKDSRIFCAVDMDTVANTLAVAEFPEEYYPIAALDSEKITAPVKYIFIRNGKIVDLKTSVAELYSITHVADSMEFSGKLSDLPENYAKSEFLSTLFTRDHRQAFLPDKIEWDEKHGFFYAGFSTAISDNFDFYITVLFES